MLRVGDLSVVPVVASIVTVGVPANATLAAPLDDSTVVVCSVIDAVAAPPKPIVSAPLLMVDVVADTTFVPAVAAPETVSAQLAAEMLDVWAVYARDCTLLTNDVESLPAAVTDDDAVITSPMVVAAPTNLKLLFDVDRSVDPLTVNVAPVTELRKATLWPAAVSTAAVWNVPVVVPR
jgi:hypothetical protein